MSADLPDYWTRLIEELLQQAPNDVRNKIAAWLETEPDLVRGSASTWVELVAKASVVAHAQVAEAYGTAFPPR